MTIIHGYFHNFCIEYEAERVREECFWCFYIPKSCLTTQTASGKKNFDFGPSNSTLYCGKGHSIKHCMEISHSEIFHAVEIVLTSLTCVKANVRK